MIFELNPQLLYENTARNLYKIRLAILKYTW